MGELAALGTAVCWSFTAIFFGYAGRRVGSDVVNRTRLLFAFFFISFTHLVLEGTLFPLDTELWRWGWLTISSVLGLVIGDAMLFYAYTLISPRVAMLVMALVPIFSAILGWLLFGELLFGWEYLGVMLAVGGVAWVVTEGQEAANQPDRRKFLLGLGMALGGALGQTSNLIFSKYALVDGYSALSATLIRIAIGIVVLWGWALVKGEIRPMLHKLQDRLALRAIVGGALVGPFLGIWFSLIAVQMTRVGIASTIMALPPVILIPLSYLFFKERVSWRGAFGTVVAIAGVAVLFLAAP